MAEYKYKGKQITSEVIKTGEIVCETEEQVERYLLEQEILPIKITKKMQSYFFKNIKKERLAFFCQQLGMLIESGVPIVQALFIMNQTTNDKYLKKVIGKLVLEVEKGCFLSESMEEIKIFPAFCRGLIMSGEIGGTLGETLLKLGGYYESQVILYKKIQKALLYPGIVMFVMLGIGITIMYFVIPRFTQMFEAVDASLPQITRVMMGVSEKLHQISLEIVMVLGVVIALLKMFFSNRQGKRIKDQLVMRLPGISQIMILRQSNIFCETLGTLISSGIPILRSLQITDDVIGNYVVHREIQGAIKCISMGGTLGEAFEQSKVLPRLLKSMIATAEKIGKLDEVLLKLANYYYKMLEMKLEKGIVLVEPLLTLMMGLLVGGMMAAIMLPTYALATQISW